MHDQIGIPACFSTMEKTSNLSPSITRSGQNVFMSVYRTKLADQCRLITVTWCKNLLLHGLSISVEGGGDGDADACKIELKPWYFWRKHGSKRFAVDGKPVDVFWDLKSARFNGETEPISDYYVAVVCGGEVALLVGDLRNDAFRRTGCRPSLIDPVLVSRKEHIFGKRKFATRLKFHEKGSLHEVSIECKNRASCSGGGGGGGGGGVAPEPEMEIGIDGRLVMQVKHLQWKFRGNDSIHFNKGRIEVYWDVHDWLFCPGLRHALFIFKPTFLSPSSSSSSSPLSSDPASGSPDFCLFLYAWKVE